MPGPLGYPGLACFTKRKRLFTHPEFHGLTLTGIQAGEGLEIWPERKNAQHLQPGLGKLLQVSRDDTRLPI